MERKEGYYWVKFKDDAATAGDMDCIMGLCFPPPNTSVIAQWIDGGWEVRGYDIAEHYFSEINENRIPMPGGENNSPVYWYPDGYVAPKSEYQAEITKPVVINSKEEAEKMYGGYMTFSNADKPMRNVKPLLDIGIIEEDPLTLYEDYAELASMAQDAIDGDGCFSRREFIEDARKVFDLRRK